MPSMRMEVVMADLMRGDGTGFIAGSFIAGMTLVFVFALATAFQ
jgi:hypothetical protein